MSAEQEVDRGGARRSGPRAARARRLLVLCLLAPTGCQPSQLAQSVDPDSVRVLPAGEVVGGVGAYGGHVWRGLPYAEPPVGAMRWRAPRAPARWDGRRVAIEHAAACPQLGGSLGGPRGASEGEPAGQEDCLFLDVYAPRWTPAEVPGPGRAGRVPVLVWIHGGGNVTGTASFYDGGNLATTHGVIVIAINYRLGPFGWLRHAALRDGASPAEDSGNFGTLDILRALEWVRDNVASFGGDPGNVTVFGESAGGHNVYSLLLSPLAKGLFHRAIVQSGGLWMSTPSEAENFADASEPGLAGSSNEVLVGFLVQDGLAPDRELARRRLAAMPKSEIAAYMRAKPASAWLAIYGSSEQLSDLPKVFRDGHVLPAREPLEAFLLGEQNRVPLVIGTNRDENKLFFFYDDRLVRKWFGMIPQARDRRIYDTGAEHLSAMWKASGADMPASAIALTQEAKVHVYRWDWDEEPRVYGADLAGLLGAAHGLEIPFVFGHFDIGSVGNMLFDDRNRPGREALSAAMMSYWTEFARSGEPGRGRDRSLPEWPAWSLAAKPRFLVLDTPADGGIRTDEGVLTEQLVLARVARDDRLRDARERCAVLRGLVGFGQFGKRDYARRPECADFPFGAGS